MTLTDVEITMLWEERQAANERIEELEKQVKVLEDHIEDLAEQLEEYVQEDLKLQKGLEKIHDIVMEHWDG